MISWREEKIYIYKNLKNHLPNNKKNRRPPFPPPRVVLLCVATIHGHQSWPMVEGGEEDDFLNLLPRKIDLPS